MSEHYMYDPDGTAFSQGVREGQRNILPLAAEIDRLRSALAEVTAERDRCRHAKFLEVEKVRALTAERDAAMKVVEAARQAVAQIRVHGETCHELTDALAALDAGRESRDTCLDSLREYTSREKKS